MTQLLHRAREAWQQLGGLHTAQEITQQPEVWRQLADALGAQWPRIQGFLGDCLSEPAARVILTGAGSSAYVGEVAADVLDAAWPARVRAVATTSLLTHPGHYLEREQPTLLVSFARSGNSPESQAAVDLVRQQLARPRFLNITCNAQGRLALEGGGHADTFTLLMPEASCDRAFAMTSSFSAMLLAALAVLGPDTIGQKLARICQLADVAQRALLAHARPIAALASEPFQRVVYLGSGPLEALAKEAALKVLELTGGRVTAIANSSLGFRHGPKSILNDASLVVVLRSHEPHARRYEQDLVDELRRDQVARRVIEVGPMAAGAADAGFEVDLQGVNAPDAWLSVLWLPLAQQLALHLSAALGLTPDSPFPDGTVNRVVQGVRIYPHGPR
jgi:tagatose-6-phosphate ketose/aldose isomerase